MLTIVTECYGGGGPGGTDKRGETKMTVLVGESGAMSIMDAIRAAGFVIVSNDALKAGSDGYGECRPLEEGVALSGGQGRNVCGVADALGHVAC